MQDLIIRDIRLGGPSPVGNEVLEIYENTPLTWPLSWVINRSEQYKGDVRVRLLTHGMEAGTVRNGYDDGRVCRVGEWKTIKSQGGWGLQFGRDGLTVETMGQFRAWFAKVKQIDILGCGAAYITPGREGKAGDGNFLCFQLAQITGSFVRASTANQEYSGRLNFGKWEGLVQTYAPTGGPGIAPVVD